MAKKSAKKATAKTKSKKTTTATKAKKKATSQSSPAKKSSAKKATRKTSKSLDPLNETGRRTKSERREEEKEVTVSERRKVQRRRQIDPTTCERDYSGDEVEFMQALDQYKHDSGRMFPTCSEILEVIRTLGYNKGEAKSLEDKCEELIEGIHTDIESAEISTIEL